MLLLEQQLQLGFRLGVAGEAEFASVGIAPAFASPDLVLGAQPPAQPHRRVGVERPIRLADSAGRQVDVDHLDGGELLERALLESAPAFSPRLCISSLERMELKAA